ncbi:hypothetical protein HKX48_006405 [Thoreauomyces humboldtii]|nr:hypothetical protein HKX48_006405 [Thoreauomyces humboldtii]
MSVTLNPSEEQAFVSSLLTHVGVKTRRYQPTYEPKPEECSTFLSPASRPFPLRTEDASTAPPPTSTPLTIKPIKAPHIAPFTISATRLEPIHDIKLRIAEQCGVAPAAQRLVYGGKALSDAKTLLDYDVGVEGATVHLFVKAGAQVVAPSEPAVVIVPTKESKSTGETSEKSLQEMVRTKGEDPALWKGIRDVLEAKIGSKEAVETVFAEFVKSYHGLCGPLSAAQRAALRKAEAAA